MAINLKESGPKIKQMEKENIGMLTEIIMKVIGLMIRLMGKASIHLQMDLVILESGKMTCNTDKEKKPGKIILILSETILMD